MTQLCASVIPAQAGIQQKKNAAQQTKQKCCSAIPGLFDRLDSRLRGNDEIFSPGSI